MTTFTGFKSLRANFTAVPNQFFDRVVGHYHPCVERVIAILIRSTLGWEDPDTGERRLEAELALSDFVRPQLCESSARKGIAGAIEAGFITQTMAATTRQPARYALRWEDAKAQAQALTRQRRAHQTAKRTGKEVMEPKWKKSRGVTVTPLRGVTVRGVTVTPPSYSKEILSEKEKEQTNKPTEAPAPPTGTPPDTGRGWVGELVDFKISPGEASGAVAETGGKMGVAQTGIASTEAPALPPGAVGELVGELIGFGIARDRAAAAVAAHGEARVREVLGHLPAFTEAKRLRAWLEKALAGGWQVGPAPREWVIKGGADIDRLLAAHGRGPVVLEMERRAVESERAGRDPEAAHRRRVAALVRAGGAGAQAVEAAQAERECNVTRAGKIGGVRDENRGERRHR